ncbi:MAG: 30S ribosomal protein S16 [Rhodospirillales bacterium]|nr:30S ribosomal protein S16 [Rhodospirillales bacterium]
MSLRIRLSRGGAKKRPFYRIVVADSRSPRDGKFIEKIGTYNPMLARDSGERLVIQEERVKYWMGVGALPSDRVARFLGDAGLVEKPATPANQTKRNMPKTKAQERAKEQASKAAAAAEAAAEAAAAPAVEEPVVEEAPAEAAAEEAPAEAAAEETKEAG